MTAEEIKEIVQQVLNEVKASSQGTDELKIASSLEGVSSLPCIQGQEVVSVPISLLLSMGIVNLSDINSLNTLSKCGDYQVMYNSVMVGYLYVIGDNMRHCVNQILVSNYVTEGITDGIPSAHIDGHVNIMRRVYNINSPHEFAPKNSWSDWEIIAGDDKPNERADFKIVDFAGFIESATVPMQSINNEATARKVYFCKDIHYSGDLTSQGGGFVVLNNDAYYLNWKNRLEWADDSFTPYSNLFYREAESGVFYSYDITSGLLLPLGGSNSVANVVLSNDIRNIYVYNKDNMPDINSMNPEDLYVITEE